MIRENTSIGGQKIYPLYNKWIKKHSKEGISPIYTKIKYLNIPKGTYGKGS